MTNKFIQTYITYISHPSTHPSAHITSIIIYITYIIISAQDHPNKSTSPSQVHQSSQVHHKYITSPSPSEQQMKKIQRALISATATVVKAQLHHSEVHEVDYSEVFEPPSDEDCTKEKRLHVRQDYLDS